MCKYNYLYHSVCQHGEFVRMTYCTEAAALSLPRLDDLSPDSAGAGCLPDRHYRPSSFHPPAIASAKDSSFSFLHSQQHRHNSMSILRPFDTGYSCPLNAFATVHECQHVPEATFSSRSALHINGVHTRAGSPPNDNLNIGLPPYSQAKLSMEIIRNNNNIPSSLDRPFSDSDTRTTQSRSEEAQSNPDESQIVRNPIRTSHSPRKSLPSHWLPSNSGPRLATAQRAKERSYKKDQQIGSPIEAKKIRGARSTVELKKAYNIDGSNYLTKEALAAVETNIASPTSAHSPSKLRQSPSKPSWRSPNTSPLHGSPSQHATLTTKFSPARAALLSPGTASGSHSRGSSSVAASLRTFHTANESPVRSPSGSEISFQSASEFLDEIMIPYSRQNTNGEMAQTTLHAASPSPTKQKAATVRKVSVPKLRLAPNNPGSIYVADSNSPNSPSSTTDGSLTSPTLTSPESTQLTCRIPRLVGTAKLGSAYGATRSSILKRAQSTQSLGSKPKFQSDRTIESHQASLPVTPPATSLRQVRTVNSMGTTPILPSHPINDMDSNTRSELHEACSTSEISAPDLFSRRSPSTTLVPGVEQTDITRKDNADQGSRTPSITTPNASETLKDPVPTDSAIIYSRKRVDSAGLILEIPHGRPTNEDFGAASSMVTSSTTPSVLDRKDEHTSETIQHAEREKSCQSTSGTTELRATAPDFVPQLTPSTPSTLPEYNLVETWTPPSFHQAPWFPLDMSGFDQHGIPWFYYMYPVKFAYDQGFRNGRYRTPRKFHNKKQRQPMHSTTNSQQAIQIPGSQPFNIGSVAQTSVHMARRFASGELMPPPTWPASRWQENLKENHLRGGEMTAIRTSDDSSVAQDISIPFASQLNSISQQDVLCNNRNSNRPLRNHEMDITAAQNFASLPDRNNDYYTKYHTVSSRHGRYHHLYAGNGLYNGRGSVGIPISATTPFPDPSPPLGRPPLGAGGQPAIIGTEACGRVDVVFAAELGGGVPCNSCAPDH